MQLKILRNITHIIRFESLTKIFEFEERYRFFDIERQIAGTVITLAYFVPN